MQDEDGWLQACDAVVADLLLAAQISNPPVDALLLSQRLQHTLLWDASQIGRGRLIRRDGETTILLRPEARPERVQWAAAHELGESVAWRVCQSVGVDADDVSPRQRETLANELAQRILLPDNWWRSAVAQSAGDLLQLKALFATASYELLAWRLLDLPEFRVITIWDQGQMTRRRCNRPGSPQRLTVAESRVWETIHSHGGRASEHPATGRVAGWAIHEPEWKREILVWEPAGEATDED